MDQRTSWKGYIRLSLVAIPMRAYTAAAPAAEQLPLHQLHESCHSRIRYQKTCPKHGEVPNEEIVKGYEYAKDEYVILDANELKAVQGDSDSDHTIQVHGFVDPDALDPIYYAGKSYYLMPDGVAGEKPYALLSEAMAAKKVWAIARIVLGGREELMVLRPKDGFLTMTELVYPSQLRDFSGYRAELPQREYNKQELELTKSLIDASTLDRFRIEQFHDAQKDKLREVIEAKVAGKEIVAAPTEESPHVINLMEALKASISKTKHDSKKKKGKSERPPTLRQRSVARRKQS